MQPASGGQAGSPESLSEETPRQPTGGQGALVSRLMSH